MNCNEAEVLLGAYALDALTADEAAAMRAHLSGCPRHASAAAELRGVAAGLPALAGPMDAPPALRGRILDAIAQTPQAARPPIADAHAGTVLPMPRERAHGPMQRSLRPAYAWAGLAAAVIFGLLAWNIVLLSGGGSESEGDRLAARATSITALRANGVEGSGTVFYFAEAAQAVIIAEDVPALAQDQTYQLWAIEGGEPRSLGLMRPDATGVGTMVVPYDADAADALAITVEPAGGSDAPTTAPVFLAEV